MGGFIGTGFAAFFASVNSGAPGTYMVTMTESQNVQTDLTIQAGQVVVVSGDEGLAAAPSWSSGLITVQQYGSLSLTRVALAGSLAVSGGGSLSLSEMAMPISVLGVLVYDQLGGAGSTLRLSGVTVTGTLSDWGVLAGTVTVEADGSVVQDPPGLFRVSTSRP